MPRGHGRARYRHKDQRAAYDLVDGRDLMNEDRCKDDGDDYLHRAEQAYNCSRNTLESSEKCSICDKTSSKCLKGHHRK